MIILLRGPQASGKTRLAYILSLVSSLDAKIYVVDPWSPDRMPVREVSKLSRSHKRVVLCLDPTVKRKARIPKHWKVFDLTAAEKELG